MSDLAGRTFLVTGANAGIGYATATALAARGGRVHLACRSAAKGEATLAAIAAKTGSDQLNLLKLDLADLASVRRCAAEFLALGEPLHVLVNNAGVAGRRGTTADGFELQFGVNHLGHFVLTRELLPRLVDAPDPRVVTVASDSHFQAKGIPFEHLRSRTKSITGMREYGVSKLCNVLFSAELGRREPRVTTCSLHPGVVASEIWRVPQPARHIITRRMLTIEQGAQTSLYCATAPQVAGDPGKYYDKCQPSEPSDVVTPDLAAQLWKYSEDAAG